jgi:KDO2-lipid IV(A) lauroyltransferase
MRFARALPRGAGLKVFSGIGTTAERLLRSDRARALENLKIAFPEASPLFRQAMAKAMFKTLGLNAYEFANLGGSSPERVTSLVERVEGQEHLDEAYGRGQGLIAITGHIGCWELMAAYFANMGYEVNVVGRELWEQRINTEVVRIRESVGYHTIDRDSGGKDMLRILKRKGIVAILIDQHTRVSGVYVPFFSRPAHTPVGAAKLALATGATLLPMAIYMTRPGRHMIRILPAIELPDNGHSKEERARIVTARCSQAIEDLIRHDPKQWVWFHRRWRAPEGAESVEVGYAAAG